jgi:hypothetical protein
VVVVDRGTHALYALSRTPGGGLTTPTAGLSAATNHAHTPTDPPGPVIADVPEAPAPEDQAPDQPEAAAPPARRADGEALAPGTAEGRATDLVFALAPADESFAFRPEGHEGLSWLLAGALLVGGAQALERLRQDDDETATGAGRGRGRL